MHEKRQSENLKVSHVLAELGLKGMILLTDKTDCGEGVSVPSDRRK